MPRFNLFKTLVVKKDFCIVDDIFLLNGSKHSSLGVD